LRSKLGNSYVIKFASSTFVTQIGIAGEKPIVQIIKQKRRKGSSNLKNYRNPKKSKRKRSRAIKILDDNFDGSYVENFEMSYKDVVTKKWIKLGIFNGNLSCFSL
jgi:hypothetical protein